MAEKKKVKPKTKAKTVKKIKTSTRAKTAAKPRAASKAKPSTKAGTTGETRVGERVELDQFDWARCIDRIFWW